jgi:hypothetical protein
MVEHVSITDPQVHEPKGITSAVAGSSYIADGVGSGGWQLLAGAGDNYGEIFINHGTTETVITTINTDVRSKENMETGDVSGFTYADGALTAAVTGTFLVVMNCSIAPAAGTNIRFHLHLAIDSGSGFVNHPHTHAIVTCTASTDVRQVPIVGILQMTAGEKIGLHVRNESDTNNVVIRAGNISIIFLG